MTINESTKLDAAHLGILNARAAAYEAWHNEQVEAIHKRLIRRRLNEEKQLEAGGYTAVMPAPQLFVDFDDVDVILRNTDPPSHNDRMQIAEIRMWLRDSVTDLCDFELDDAIKAIERTIERLDWIVNKKSRAGSRRYRILDDASATRLTNVLVRVEALLAEVTRVQALVSA